MQGIKDTHVRNFPTYFYGFARHTEYRETHGENTFSGGDTRRGYRTEEVTTLMTDVCFGDLPGQSAKCLSDRRICQLLEELQPDPNLPPEGEKEKKLLKLLKAELMRRVFLVVEQQKLESQNYQMAIAG